MHIKNFLLTIILLASLFTLLSCSGQNQGKINPILPPQNERVQDTREIQVKPVTEGYWNSSAMVDSEIWIAHIDESGRITRALGKGLNPVEPLSFIDKHPQLFGVSSDELILKRDEVHGGMRVAIYRQSYDGIEIENTLIRIIYGKTGKLVSYGSDTYTDFTPSGTWMIDASTAADSLKSIDQSKFISSKKYYYAKGNSLIPAWRIDFDNNSYLVDATNGEILEIHPNRYEWEHQGHVNGGIKPWSPLDSDITVDIYGLPVDFYNYDQYFSGRVYTDHSGNYSFTHERKWRVYNMIFDNPWIHVEQAWDSGMPSMDIWDWSNAEVFNEKNLDAYSSPAERNVFHYGTACHDWFWTVEPEFNLMNFQLPAFVDKIGECTAYAYTHDEPSIHFFQPYDICTNTGESPTIIYHEYGHIYVSRIYFSPSGALHEACADITANRITENYMVGPDMYGAGTYRRVSNNDRMWPAPECEEETHCVGNVLAGAFWNLSENIGNNLTDNYWHFTNYMNTVPFPEKAADVVLIDDDDDNITNGCPHYNEIYDAFFVHHNLDVPPITNPQTEGVIIDITPLNLPHTIPYSTGGSFSYHLRLQNLDNHNNQLQIWASAEIPGSNWFGPMIPPGYLTHSPLWIVLQQQQLVELDIRQDVPWHVPYDMFYYHVRLGQFVDHVNDVIEDEGILEVRIL